MSADFTFERVTERDWDAGLGEECSLVTVVCPLGGEEITFVDHGDPDQIGPAVEGLLAQHQVFCEGS